MSHSKERVEKTCLNCGAQLYGRYCHVCGQENIEPRQSAWHLVTHFFYDITHFDGSFFTTLKDLLIKPGFLSREFMQGRRNSYLHPIRMYVFTSAFFFLIFFSLVNVKDFTLQKYVKVTSKSIDQLKQDDLKSAKTRSDSAAVEAAYAGIQKRIRTRIPGADSSRVNGKASPGADLFYSTVEEYDSVQKSLPENLRSGWMKRKIVQKIIELNKKFHTDETGFLREFFTLLLHNFPKLLFISLPLFALLLKLLYVRRKQFYYADHGIFSIHLYIYYFIALLVYFGVFFLKKSTGWEWLWILNAAIALYSVYYGYRAMIRFYGQGWLKTGVKYVLLGFSSLMVILTLFVIFVFFSILEV